MSNFFLKHKIFVILFISFPILSYSIDTVDVALRVTTLDTFKMAVGDEAKFTITIYNQGNVALTNIGVIDYLPANTILSPTNQNGWTLGANNLTAIKTFTSFLYPGDSLKTDIYLVIQAGASGNVKNTAETVSLQDTDYINRNLDEYDSTPDGFNTELYVKDNIINEHAKLFNGDDEDDHDIAYVVVAPDVYGYESVKLTTDYNNDGLVTVGDIITLTITYINNASATTNFQITNAIGNHLRRKGTITASSSNVTGLSLNSSYNGITAISLLNSGVTLGVDGKLIINIPLEVRGSASGQTLQNQVAATGNGITGYIVSDAVDNGTCTPPPNVNVPSGSIVQPCTINLDSVFFSVALGNPDIRAFKSVKLTKDSDGNGVPSVGDTLTYTINVYNVGTANVNNIQISDVLNSGFSRSGAGPTSLNFNSGSNISLNSSFNGTTDTNLLGVGSSLEADTGYLRLNFPVKVLVDANGKLIGNLANISGDGISNVQTDAVDNSLSGFCAPPAWITVPTSSIPQNCSIANNDSTFVNILKGTPILKNYKTVRWYPSNSNTSGMPSVYDTLVYTIACFNTGTAHLDSLQLIDTLPTGLQRIGISNLSATSGTNALFNSNYPDSSFLLLKPNNSTLPITLKANGYIYVNIKTLVTAAASGLQLSNQAILLGRDSTKLYSDAKDSLTAPAILIDTIRQELRNNVLKSYIQSSQTSGNDPTLITINTLLPVQIVNFYGQNNDKINSLFWEVENENIWGYELEKSKDGINYQFLTFINAKNTVGENHYYFIDNHPFNFNNYYRIKIIEKSSKFEYSNIILVKNNNEERSSLLIYPNPVQENESINIFLDNISNGKYNLTILDLLGKAVIKNELEATDNRITEKILSPNDLHSGMYLIFIQNEIGNSYKEKFYIDK